MDLEKGLRKIAFFILVFFIVLLFMPFINKEFSAQILLYEVMPFYDINLSHSPDKEVVGTNDVIFEKNKELVIPEDKYNDPNEFKKAFYVVDKKTDFTQELFNYNDLMNIDVKMPHGKILIFHTHANELFSDSKDISEGIVMVGDELKKELESLGIECVHIKDSFDIVNGKAERTGSYERMEKVIKKYLEQNPDITMTIDLHRDGVNENTHLVTDIDGKPTAQVMFFNGISKIYEKGVLKDIENLKNPYVKENLALSLKAKKLSDNIYPDFSRKIYINAYRYSNHLLPHSMLIELGAQTNTKQEALNAAKPLAEVLYKTLNSD